MRGTSRTRPRVAATTILCLLIGVAVTARQHTPEAADPHAGHVMVTPSLVAAALPPPAPLSRTEWTVTTDDGQASAATVLDGDPGTAWRTAATARPHHITVDTHDRVAVSGLTYLPPAGEPGGRIGRYSVQISNNGTKWSAPVATGTFADDDTVKTVTIGTVVTRFVRLNAITDAGEQGTWAAAAEIELLGGTDPALPRTGWSAAADSAQTGSFDGAAVNAIDGNTASLWHTVYTPTPVPPLPHWFTIDMKTTNLVSGLVYLPRQGTGRNGTIGRYRVETSMNNSVWAPVATSGTFADNQIAQTVSFPPQLARYVRLTALSEAGNRGQWSSAAEINLLGRADPTLSRSGWTAAASDAEAAFPVATVLDGNAATFWHSRYSPAPAAPLPHSVTLDMKAAATVGGLSYLPRPAASANGRIGRFRVATSTDGSIWADQIPNGTFGDSPALQTVVFPPITARYVRLTAVTEAANRGPWSTAAELNVLGPSSAVVPKRGTWSGSIGFPLVPAAIAQLPNGKLLTWAAYLPQAFSGGTGRTVTATYDPATEIVTQRTVSTTEHDMFCPGISALPDGRIFVTGGNNSNKTSIYNASTDSWAVGPPMITPRGYQSSVIMGDGRIFTIGGSWSGPRGGVDGAPHKSGEVWSPASGWRALPGADVVPMLTADANKLGDYRKDNHAWLFAWTGGRVLQAGPSRQMNWYGLSGTGSVASAGLRGDDGDAMNGNAVMYDTGKILAVGGAPSYENSNATANAYVLSLTASSVTARKVSSMANTRAFANSVVLPDGKVLVVGGQNYAAPFSDNAAVLAAELWDPVSETFSPMASATVPRTYHSVAVLMRDGRVFSGGGGLCGTGCANNHYDGQIFTPPYLLNADGSEASRPVIESAPSTAANGTAITVSTNRAVTAFAIVRMGTATHTVNTDQRRLSLVPTPVDGGYQLTIPADADVAVPGYWMLFAMDSKGVPSIARTIRIG